MSTVELGGDLGIESSTELKNRLAPLVAQAGELTLDASRSPASTRPPCRCCVHSCRPAARQAWALASTVAPQPSVTPRACWRHPGPGPDATHDNLKSVENAA